MSRLIISELHPHYMEQDAQFPAWPGETGERKAGGWWQANRTPIASSISTSRSSRQPNLTSKHLFAGRPQAITLMDKITSARALDRNPANQPPDQAQSTRINPNQA